MRKIRLLLLLLSCAVATQGQPQPAPSSGPADEAPSASGVGIKVSFRPSVAIVVGIFTMIFSLTFLLLMYAKFCHSSSSPPLLPTINSPGRGTTADTVQSTAEATGVGKAVIESLPFFRFAALRGARQGLECAVCLARFEDTDLLRLLPRCRHAFHLDCVDRWLHTSASCPLCRARVHADDAELGLKYAAASARFVFGATGDDLPAATDAAAVPSSGASGRDLMSGIFVERVPSSRFGVGGGDNSNDLDRHGHRIVVSDAVFKSRWSDLNSADLLALDTEMLHSFSSGRFDDPGEIVFFTHQEEEKQEDVGGRIVEKKRLLETSSNSAPSSSALIRGVRSMSEIVRLPRVARPAARTDEERRWAPIARRTARWFAKREEETAGHVHVHVRASSSSSRVLP